MRHYACVTGAGTRFQQHGMGTTFEVRYVQMLSLCSYKDIGKSTEAHTPVVPRGAWDDAFRLEPDGAVGSMALGITAHKTKLPRGPLQSYSYPTKCSSCGYTKRY